MEALHLIVGLGNPGSKYVRTRHNVGFMAVEEFASRKGSDWTFEEKFKARLGKGDHLGRRLLLCEPQTYMNLTGTAVRGLVDYYRIRIDRLMLLVDDADIPFGSIRLRSTGSSGGHHGLESVERELSTRDYPRLRIGIGRQVDGVREITEHVLGKFSVPETRQLPAVLERVADQIECWLTAGMQKAMNQFNGAIESPMPKES